MNINNSFDITVIMPIFNMEEYLDDAIGSIISQDIGFEEHIQLVLINDGSVDRSEEICLSYQERYPNNIVYKYKENGGVSSAFNYGFDFIQGELVNFFGSDDMWTSNSMRCVWDFYTKHKEEIDVITCKMEYFGSQHGDHPLNYRFEEDAVIDLNEKHQYSQCSDGNCFFKSSAIGDRRFDERLKNAEDALFLNDILLDKCKIGIVKEPTYMYRRRSGSSAQLNSKRNRYVIEPELFCRRLFAMSRERYGRVLPFISYVMMYELQWRLIEKPTEDITQEEIDNYEGIIKELLSEIDDNHIVFQRGMMAIKKAFAFRLKYGDDFYQNGITWRKGRAYKGSQKVFDGRGALRCAIRILEVEDDQLVLKCTTDLTVLNTNFSIFIKDNKGKKYETNIEDFPIRDVYGFNKKLVVKGVCFTFKVPLKARKQYGVYIQFDGAKPYRIKPFFDYFAKLDHRTEHSYFVVDKKYIIKYEDAFIKIYNYRLKTHIASEYRYIKEIRNDDAEGSRSYIKYRLLYYLYGLFLGKKDIWLISDRNLNATDNGSALFKYLSKSDIASQKRVFFVLKKESRDYPVLKKYGKIVEPGSLKYLLLFLHSSMIISAHGDLPVTRPFPGATHYIYGLLKFKYVYLQHGIMQGNLEGWLNIFVKNIKLLVTSTDMETTSIINGCYGYTKKEVKLLGMPRFDELGEFEHKNKVLFLPTWRANLAGALIGSTRTREYVKNFKENEYCKFYNSLINNEKLIRAMKEYGYYGEFYLHPMFLKQSGDFLGNSTIRFIEDEADYERVLGESAILITDYSGVQFDFAYLRKPIVYSQFDDIYQGGKSHSYNGSYFDYEKQGFGPICKTVEQTVECIINYMKNGCVLDEEYQGRVDSFFKYNDFNNSERVANEILNI